MGNDNTTASRPSTAPADILLRQSYRARGWSDDFLSRQSKPDNDFSGGICHYYLRGKCSWGSKCQDAHYDSPYQWRWRRRGSGNWTEFNEDENDIIERAFCDPTNDWNNVLTYGMKIDFNSMCGKDNGDSKFDIERLSTPSSITHGNQTWSTKWLWYWKNPIGLWVQFGDLDKFEGCFAGIRSSELEEAFVDNPYGTATFMTTGTHSYAYTVNFRNMIQRNIETFTTRELRRRPEFINKLDVELNNLRLVLNTDIGLDEEEIKPPENWSIPDWKNLSEHVVVVPVKESDSEYGEIKSLFLQSMPKAHIKSIERIENGDLWENYMMKKSKMLKKKNEIQLGETRVFHGTQNKNIAAICKQGFDFRLNGQATGTIHGKGCYFATNSKYSDDFVEKGTVKYMFVAKILPGEYVRGKPSYCRPPHKDASDQTSDLYDSCVDDEEDPEIFVIFDNYQIYPEFLIQYTN